MLLRLLLYGGAFFIVIPLVFAYQMTRSYRLGGITAPARGFEAVTLVSEGLKLRGWLSRGRNDSEKPAVIIAHGLGDRLESYQEHARFFIDRGHTVLLFDFRGHGGSEGSRTSLGAREKEDVRAAMRSLREKALSGKGVVLMGHSMGAVATLLAAAAERNDDDDNVDDLRAVIVEAPYDTFRDTVNHHAKILYGIPSWVPIVPLSILAAEWIAGFDADDVDCVEAAKQIEAPLLAIVDGEDRRMPKEVVSRIVEAHPGKHELWIADGVDHVGAIHHENWQAKLTTFLDQNGL